LSFDLCHLIGTDIEPLEDLDLRECDLLPLRVHHPHSECLLGFSVVHGQRPNVLQVHRVPLDPRGVHHGLRHGLLDHIVAPFDAHLNKVLLSHVELVGVDVLEGVNLELATRPDELLLL